MFSLYGFEIKAYITHTVLLRKLEKGIPSRQTNVQKGPLSSHSLIQAIRLGQRAWAEFESSFTLWLGVSVQDTAQATLCGDPWIGSCSVPSSLK